MDLETVLLTAGVSVATSVATAMFTSRIQSRHQYQVWRRELAIRIADTQIDNRPKAEALAQQIATGLLIVEVGGERQKHFVAAHSRIIIGRSVNCTIAIPDGALSKEHFAVSSDGNSVFVEDLGALSGVNVNGIRVHGRRSLMPGDIISVGPNVKLEFRPLGDRNDWVE